MPQSKSLKPKNKILSKASIGSSDIVKKYDKYFHKFLAKSLNISLMDSMIYGVNRNGTTCIGYDSDDEFDSEKADKPNIIMSHFVPSGKQNGVMCKGRIVSKPKDKEKSHSHFNYAYTYNYPTQKPKFVKNSGKTNPKGTIKIWVPKDKIVYVADVLSSGVKTLVMVPGL